MLTPGETLHGRYRVVRVIGSGGMGTVYEGENLRIKRRVAIKVLHASAAQNAELVIRFEREAQAAGRIGSDHITEVLDLGELAGGARYIVMEYLDGEPLAGRMARHGRMRAEELLPLVRQMLLGLAKAHAAGIVHRDIKPDNIFIVREKAGLADFVKLLDFGVSKFREAQDNLSLTRTGSVVGTPSYLSPEQARGSSEATPLSDLYAVGVILYEGATGELPFRAIEFNDLVFQIVLAPLVPPIERMPEVTPALNSIICKAMARAPEHRFQSAPEFIEALDAYLATGAGVELPPTPLAGGASGTLIGASFLAPGPSAGPALAADGTAQFSPVHTLQSHNRTPSPVSGPARLVPGSARAGLAIALVAVGVLGSAGALGWYWQRGETKVSIESTTPAGVGTLLSASAPAPATQAERQPKKRVPALTEHGPISPTPPEPESSFRVSPTAPSTETSVVPAAPQRQRTRPVPGVPRRSKPPDWGY